MIEQTDLAYAAGLIDGEGSISIKTRIKGSYHLASPFISVANTDRRPLRWMKARFGGNESLGRAQTRTCRAVYRWELTGTTQVDALLRMLLPYLIIKQEQARLVLEYRTMRYPGPGRPPGGMDEDRKEKRLQVCREIRALNKRGPRSFGWKAIFR